MVLHLEAGGKKIDLPLKADAMKGGFVVDNKALDGVDLGAGVEVVCKWLMGLQTIPGPGLPASGARVSKNGRLASTDQNALVVGRDATLHLQADDASCVDSIRVQEFQGKELKADWKLVKPDQVEVTAALKGRAARLPYPCCEAGGSREAGGDPGAHLG